MIAERGENAAVQVAERREQLGSHRYPRVQGTGTDVDVLDPEESREPAGRVGTAAQTGRDLRVDMDAAQLSAINPLFVMIVIPALNFLVFMPLSKRGIDIKPLQKMTVGMFLTALAFVAAAILQQIIQAAGEGQVHSLWQVVQYFIMTVAEVLVSVTGLEFAYTQAPRPMKSTIMGFWLLTISLGNVLVSLVTLIKLPPAEFFWVFAALMLGAGLLFGLRAYFYWQQDYMQH